MFALHVGSIRSTARESDAASDSDSGGRVGGASSEPKLDVGLEVLGQALPAATTWRIEHAVGEAVLARADAEPGAEIAQERRSARPGPGGRRARPAGPCGRDTILSALLPHSGWAASTAYRWRFAGLAGAEWNSSSESSLHRPRAVDAAHQSLAELLVGPLDVAGDHLGRLDRPPRSRAGRCARSAGARSACGSAPCPCASATASAATLRWTADLSARSVDSTGPSTSSGGSAAIRSDNRAGRMSMSRTAPSRPAHQTSSSSRLAASRGRRTARRRPERCCAAAARATRVTCTTFSPARSWVSASMITVHCSVV